MNNSSLLTVGSIYTKQLLEDNEFKSVFSFRCFVLVYQGILSEAFFNKGNPWIFPEFP